ncbi:MAG: DUF4363 family protein [Oscillospiraceae bacterium]|nr:DUF4363 family protein [Oscillospiraceae bacterium]
MRSVIISSLLLIILIISIGVNAYYVNSVSTEMLDMTFSLPSEYNYINSLSKEKIEICKTDINKLIAKWEKNSLKISLAAKYSDFERVNTAVYSLRDYFFSEYYGDYIAARKRLIAALEKQKHNELPNWENIF